MEVLNKLFTPDSEVMLLSTILKSPELIHSTDGLRFFMFSSTPHQVLFEEFEELRDRSLAPDPSLVGSSLESKNALDRAGGRKYLEFLLSRDTSESAFKEHLEIVMASYKGRSLVSLASGIKKENINATNIDDIINSTRKGLDDLVQLRGGESTLHLSDLTKDAYEEIISRVKNPGIRGVTWGIDSIDKTTGGKSPGDVWIVAGRPGAGKTALICNSILADGLAGVPSLLIEREMRAQELVERLICIDTGIHNTNLRLGVLNQEQIDKMYASLNKLKKLPIYIDTNYKASNTFYVESTVNKFKNKFGIQNVYLDYIQLLTERDEGQTQEIGRLTRLFKILSNELNICSILGSQLNRNVESRDDKRPLLSDMKQSGSIEEDADFVVGLYRDEYYNKETKYKGLLEYIILKHRNGPTGTVTTKFDGPTYRITEA